jgi:ABC-type polysaccharide/polyol phosphate export permease
MLAIPALFVSGLIVPFEFMSWPVRAFSSLLPSTMGINAMRFASLYQSAAFANVNIIFLAVEFLALAAAAFYCMHRMRRE